VTEMRRIDAIINNEELDSISGHNSDDVNYKYWIKDGVIIKLFISEGNYECFNEEEYYFKENGNVFGIKRHVLCIPNAMDYKAVIGFNDSTIAYEEYWLGDSVVSKTLIQETLNQFGYSIEVEIVDDQETKKSKGLLNIKDFAKRLNFNIPSELEKSESISATNPDISSNPNQEIKILFFEEQWGPYDNQKTSYKFTFKGEDVEIQYTYADNILPLEKALLKDGKIVTEYGYSDVYSINQNSLCVPNPETGETECYSFVPSKSTHDIEETMNPELPGYFKGQPLKVGEKIIKMSWNKENVTNYDTDMSYSGVRYASKSSKVPLGKKWVLLYIDEDFTFESGHVVGSVPDLFIDNKNNRINNRRFSNENDINLSKAKDENIKIYSGSTVKAISSRTNGRGVGDNFIEYHGELWFLEIND
jgi:sporulation protein YlmC with PRC-barrel domain